MTHAIPRRPPPAAGGAFPEPKIDLGVQWRPETHRSGWGYALDALACLHVPGGVRLEGFIEKKFAWGQDPGDLRNDPRPYTTPWVGFWHNPPVVHQAFRRVGHGHAPDDILARGLWRESAPYCLGLFTLSRYLQRWLQARVPIPVCSLLHPTGRPSVRFSPGRYAANPRKKVVQIGWWLRRFESLRDLDVPALEKVALSPFPGSPDWYSAEGWADYGKSPGVTQIPYLDNRGYDELLAENVAFLDLYDSSANNAIVECIARLTPVLVNPLPAVVEYLGEGYPLYFTDLGEAAAKAQDIGLVIAAHQYLRDAPVQQILSGESFRLAFTRSRIYRNLPSPTGAGRRIGPDAGHRVIGPDAGHRVAVLASGIGARGGFRPLRPAPSPQAAPQAIGPSAGSPAVTIFCAVRAADRRLERFLGDLCGQTAFNSCELLLFDVRGSHRDPGTVRSTISAYQEVHPNISYRPLDFDPGCYQIWNQAIQAGRSSLLANATLADRRVPDWLADNLAVLHENGGIDVVFSTQVPVTAQHRAEFSLEDLFPPAAPGRSRHPLSPPHGMPVWRRSLHGRFGLLNPWDFGATADLEFWRRCASGGARFMVLCSRPAFQLPGSSPPADARTPEMSTEKSYA